MHICSMVSFEGKNIYSHKPVVKMLVDIGKYGVIPTKDIPGFNDRIVKAYPGLYEHYCGVGYRGGFLDRLREGTYLGHVLEHVILEMQLMIGYDIKFGKTRVVREPSVYNVIYGYENQPCGLETGKMAVAILNSFIDGQDVDLDRYISALNKIKTETDLGPSTRAIVDEAIKLGIPVTKIGNDSLVQLGYGAYSRKIAAAMTDATSCISADMVSNKHLTKSILEQYNIPIPYGNIAYTEESAVMLANYIGYPVVVKPYDGNQGKGITLQIGNEEGVRKAYLEAGRHSRAVVVEKYVSGKDYRLLVVGEKVVAAAERKPASVTGDGTRTIKELIDLVNLDEIRGDDHEKPLTRIIIDDAVINTLSSRDLTLDYVPKSGEVVALRKNANLSTGGTAEDCTDSVHPVNCDLAVRAAKAMQLDIAGVDIVAGDISVPITNGGAIVEVNAAPGLRMHIYPSGGKSRNVAEEIVRMLFPPEEKHELPIVAVTGTNGKTTTTRLIGHTLSICGMSVGMTTTSGIYINGKCVLKGDNTGPVSAQLVLSHSSVQAAVLETARGGIVRKGLGYELADVGVITNISDDHLGIDGINTLEDLAYTKALVVEAVKEKGFSVLNAEDEMVDYLIKRAKGRLVLFSKNKDNSILIDNLAKGAIGAYVDGDTIIIHDENQLVPIIKVDKIPITFGGMAECNVENALTAAAALYCMDVSPEAIAEGLRSFHADALQNPGRFNLFDMGGFSIMIDYGHNKAGYQAVIKAAQRFNYKRLVGIIGMPGDRMNSNIREVGEISAKAFDRIYIKEDIDLRGREKGEVASLLYDSITASGYLSENITSILEEPKALESAMLDAQPGDLIIVFYEEFEPLIKIILDFQEEFKNHLTAEKEQKEEVQLIAQNL